MDSARTQSVQFDTVPFTDGELLYCERLPLADSKALLARLLRDTPWQQHEINLFGKRHPQPRLEAWYGDPGAHYSYSGINHNPLPWTSDLAALRQQLEQLCAARFNSVLLNYYRGGDDAMGLHADDEAELGATPVIASLSLGATRRMYFRHKRDKKLHGPTLDLADSSLLIMRGTTQQHWKHGIRKTRRECGPRINLTFRRIVSDRPTRPL